MMCDSWACDLVELRDKVAGTLGKCGATDTVSRAILAKLRAEWLPVKPRKIKDIHFLLQTDYCNKLRNNYKPYSSGNGNKIELIKLVRTDYENQGYGRFGLKEAKEYIEHVCEHGPETEFIRSLPGYIPF
jgi:hypothetical protein